MGYQIGIGFIDGRVESKPQRQSPAKFRRNNRTTKTYIIRKKKWD